MMSRAKAMVNCGERRMSRNIKLSRELCRPNGGRRIDTLGDALNFIDRDVPKDRRHAPHWHHAREMLTRAVRTRDPVEIERATTVLERAMRKETSVAEPGLASAAIRHGAFA